MLKTKDFDDVLLPQLAAGHVLEDGHGAVQLPQSQDLVELHGLAGGDVIDDNAGSSTRRTICA